MRGWVILVLGVVLGLSIAVGVKFLGEEKAYAQGSNSEVGRYKLVQVHYEVANFIEKTSEPTNTVWMLDTLTGETYEYFKSISKKETSGSWDNVERITPPPLKHKPVFPR